MLAGGSRLADHLRLYTAILSAVEENYADEVKSDRLVSSSIREMLRTLDPHSNFLETKEYRPLQERQKGSYYGLGITVQSVDGNITVVSPFEGTPAHRLGIRAGDVISKIEDEDARGMSIDDAVKRLRGPKGTPVHITIVRQGYDTPLEFTVIRDEIPLHSVPYYFMATQEDRLHPPHGLQRDHRLPARRAQGLRARAGEGAARLVQKGATSMILDIRDNPGGLLDQAFAVSNLFLKKGQLVVFTRGRTKRDESSYVTETESRYADLPLIVLVSRHSASASEIVAGAIQDHDRGLIVGETTFGKGLVQTIMPLRNVRGYALALTTARYYTPSGRSIQRDYGSTALEDYVAPKDRRTCDEGGGEAKLTDAGRKVYGGDGITPDYCVEPETPSKFVAYLIARQAFLGFSRGFVASEDTGTAQIAGAGSRSDVASAKVRIISPRLQGRRQRAGGLPRLPGSPQAAVHRGGPRRPTGRGFERQILEEVLRQVFGEGEARRRSMAWDPQVQKALELVAKAELLLQGPAAVHGGAGRRAASPGHGEASEGAGQRGGRAVASWIRASSSWNE